MVGTYFVFQISSIFVVHFVVYINSIFVYAADKFRFVSCSLILTKSHYFHYLQGK